MLDIDASRLGTDVAVPEDPDGELSTTPTGDMALVSGRPNLAGALRRRVTTSPGEMVHRPTFGAGVAHHLEELGTPAQHARLAATVRRQVLQDSRLSEARARVRTSSAALGEPAGLTLLTLSYRLRDDTQDEITTVLSE